MIRVLLADDHAVVREGLRLLLEAQPGMEICGEAGNGFDAVAIAQRVRPEVVVIDIAMPELNGIEAARRIRSVCPETGIVVLSMHATIEHIHHALEAGALAYVLKESAGQELVAAIRAAERGECYISSKIALADLIEVLDQRRNVRKKSPLNRLSSREREVLQLVVEGKSSKEIASRINLSPKTVETYRHRLMGKLGVHDVPGLVRFALEHAVVPPA
ncbi:MAG: response regulator transcription factor [Candidatus Hydrogenedentes bacterium]|nr:response regulator transcription factor [Candidatus Hydrogenedentota bacterium]